MLADGRGAGEGDLADRGVRDQVLGHLGRHAIDQVQHAGRQAGIGQGPEQLGARARRFLRPLDDQRAAGGQAGGGLAHHLIDREVPRGEGGHDADRFAHHDLGHIVGARRDGAAVQALSFTGHEFQGLGGAVQLPARVGQGLAVLQGHLQGDVVDPLAQQGRALDHDAAALQGRGLAPDLKPALGRRDGAVQLGLARMGHRTDHLARGRVVHRQDATVVGCGPLAVDQQQDITIGTL